MQNHNFNILESGLTGCDSQRGLGEQSDLLHQHQRIERNIAGERKMYLTSLSLKTWSLTLECEIGKYDPHVNIGDEPGSPRCQTLITFGGRQRRDRDRNVGGNRHVEHHISSMLL